MSESRDGLEERLRNELELLGAMYPGCIAFESRGRELKYSPTSAGDGLTKGVLVLRLPDHYPAKGLPDLITAKDAKGLDARTQVSAAFSELAIVEGEEALDAFILAFQDFINELARDSPPQDSATITSAEERKQRRKTVVIWLHHLLNTNKRKLALSPGLDAGSVSGLTRPGYPGVMVFSGPKDAVDSHVAELRSQRWQAFQVRYDSEQDGALGKGDDDHDHCEDLVWGFEHSTGVCEVESLGEMAQGIARAEHRETFLRVMGLK
ncbi:hypothetical protein INS49_000607 [Diaporthe citri]|uniref:uncharacterized protein n=1 Tax=Diaporthe citri TaxID=83186 RepID=UPI001C815CC1|nr:uncharacterized protein INS49_000607 [Diaporthe citri]KAG6366430.1 hypothetical protein INS49_000607 [Diaporthe citri]